MVVTFINTLKMVFKIKMLYCMQVVCSMELGVHCMSSHSTLRICQVLCHLQWYWRWKEGCTQMRYIIKAFIQFLNKYVHTFSRSVHTPLHFIRPCAMSLYPASFHISSSTPSFSFYTLLLHTLQLYRSATLHSWSGPSCNSTWITCSHTSLNGPVLFCSIKMEPIFDNV